MNSTACIMFTFVIVRVALSLKKVIFERAWQLQDKSLKHGNHSQEHEHLAVYNWIIRVEFDIFSTLKFGLEMRNPRRYRIPDCMN